ncbi:hypothetical protein [Desertivirga brevis]|uniref:hypothetical protein n=1 Tax=Desertivirga brevis TaxID=2810310 RepID=UPI001A95E630|nr:hypothetical protein [Pedobacter sp. SYSU D00873]
MARVDKKGILHGPVDNILYREYRGMQIAQIKPGKVKQSIASKEASLEFGLAASTAANIRALFIPGYKANDGGMANRLTALTLKCIKTASHKRRGERDIHDGDPDTFSGFQFNKNSLLEDCLRIKPQLTSTEEGKVIVRVPAFTSKDLRAPAADHYIIRFLAISFNFKTSMASYLSSKEIKINIGANFEGAEIEIIESLPPGRLVLLGMFIHAYKYDHYDGYTRINNKTWSPGAIIGGWQAPPQEEPEATDLREAEKAIVGEVEIHKMPYSGLEILKKFQDLWVKQAKAIQSKVKEKPPIPDIEAELPIGDFRMKR